MKDLHGSAPGEIPSLNGIRAISVIIVLLSHAGLEQIVPGGFGVTIFFFLSGFLITTLMLREQRRDGAINIGAFYIRRFYRLVPPLLVMLALAYGLTLANLLPGNITAEGIAAQFFYFANYFEIFFDGSNRIPTGTGVLWSLAVEEHFYIVFPILMAGAFALRLSNRSMLITAAGLSLAILLWRTYLVYALHVSEPRIYYSSDTRIDSIIYGCMLAFICAMRGLDGITRKKLSTEDYALLALGLGILAITFIVRDFQFRETLRYSLQGIAFIPLFYLAVGRPDSWPFRLLSNRLLARLGVYSYSIYLIHRVIIVALIDNVPALGGRPVVLALASLALSVLFAMLVDRFVDGYFRHRRRSPRKSTVAVAQTATG
ncbi:acyltransferase [Corticibacterium sp. UT-5YL-CI-8]|nr:acyltransferase [Tianweitania sp. UT-5YL-CI-8]